jgi:carboxypeptidase T
MKLTTGLLVFILTPIMFASAAADVVSWARVYTPDEEAYESLVYRHDLDIASARPAEYVEVIAPQSELDELGYPYEYLQYDCLSPESFGSRGYSGYHNYDEFVSDMEAMATDYPDICTLTDMGQGHVGLGEIWLLKISDDVETDEPDEADLLITGVHHAREPMSLEVPLAFARYLCKNYAEDQGVQNVVDNLEFYIMPLMNVDGYIYDDVENERNWWRKNGRDNDENGYYFESYDGVDNNRNYPYMWGYDDDGSSGYPDDQTYRGPSAGSEPENQIVMNLSQEKRFKAAISYHQHGELILRPWGYIDSYCDNDDKFVEMADVINEEIYNHLGYYYLSIGGWEFYNTNGGFVDYFYGVRGTLAVTIELNQSFYPSDTYIKPTCDMMNDAMMAWAEWCIDEFTEVELGYFNAEWRDGSAELAWDVSDGSTTAGFNLYREPDDGSGKALVNRELITGESPYKYVDTIASPVLSYDFYLEALDDSGTATTHGPVHLEASGDAKVAFALMQTRPNPASGAVTFAFSVPEDTDVELAIYDITGRKVTTVAAGSFPAGEHSIAADLVTTPPGVYVYRLTAGGETAAKKLVITR